MLKKNFHLASLTFISIGLIFGCSSPQQQTTEVTTDSVEAVNTAQEPSPVEEAGDDFPTDPLPNNIVRYNVANEDDVRKSLETFTAMSTVNEFVSRYFAIKDSLIEVRNFGSLTAEDSLLYAPAEEKAYNAILAYKKLMAVGLPKQQSPGLLSLTRVVEADDSSGSFLPELRPSNFLAQGNFFFIGGAPFISKLQSEDNTIFKDAQGKPETRFSSTVTENANYFPQAITSFINRQVNITYGGPLGSRDYGQHDVNGIGTLIHNFVGRIPAVFITERGPVEATVVSMEIKLIPEYFGCSSDQPRITFACSQNIDESEILAVFIPYRSGAISTSQITRPSEHAWIADLNNDGIPDLACVSGTLEGVSAPTIATCLWYINVNGEWKIIDAATELDCT